MSKKDKYLIDYEKLYPGVDIPPEVLAVLKKSDRKMMYVELDLKTEHYIDRGGREIVLPSRERSLDLMCEDDAIQFMADEESTEDQAIQRIKYEHVRAALQQLEPEELALIKALYLREVGERAYAKEIGLSQKGVNKRRHKVLAKLRDLLKNK